MTKGIGKERKFLRLKEFDNSPPGACFVTISANTPAVR